MSLTILAIILAALAGAFMAVQGALNTGLSKVCGLLEASWIVHLSGAILITVLLWGFKLGRGNLMHAAHAPLLTFLGGPLNVAIIYLVIASMPRIGVARATTAIIAAQVTVAAIIDHFGLLGMRPVAFSMWKGVGLVLLAIGTKLLLS